MPVLLTKGLLTQGGRLSGSNGQEGLIELPAASDTTHIQDTPF